MSVCGAMVVIEEIKMPCTCKGCCTVPCLRVFQSGAAPAPSTRVTGVGANGSPKDSIPQQQLRVPRLIFLRDQIGIEYLPQ